MATHKWHFTHHRDVKEEIRKIPHNDQIRVYKCMEELLKADNPKAVQGVKKLTASENKWRAKQGTYRIIFTIDTTPLEHDNHEYLGTIHFVSVSHRKDAY